MLQQVCADAQACLLVDAISTKISRGWPICTEQPVVIHDSKMLSCVRQREVHVSYVSKSIRSRAKYRIRHFSVTADLRICKM